MTLEQLQNILDAHREFDDIVQSLNALGCIDVDGKMFNTIYRTLNSVIEVVDPSGWICWHIYENDYGKNEYEAGYGSNSPIRNTEDLLKLINHKSE